VGQGGRRSGDGGQVDGKDVWLIAKNAQHCYGRDRVILG